MPDHEPEAAAASSPSSEAKLDAPTTHAQAWLAPAVFAVAALCAVLHLVLHGCSCGHDFEFHLLSWLEAASQWQHGIGKPVWAFTPAFNAGEPRLLMYPPLSWATGAFLTLLLPWAAVPIAFTWLVLFLCGLTMHRLLRRWTTPAVAILGGCLYMVNPYMLFVSYERTAYAELMAAAWMPLLLAAMLRPRITAGRVACVVALLWLTNAPAAVVGCYSILLLGLARLLLQRGWRPGIRLVGTVATGVLVGLLADAFYLVPMGWERRFVQLALAIVPIATPVRNFLFAHDADLYHTHVLVQASWIAVALFTAAMLCGIGLLLVKDHGAATVQNHRSMRARNMAATEHLPLRVVVAVLLAFSAIVFFLLSRWSRLFWQIGPELVFLQFPWRFLTIEAAAAVALVSLFVGRLASRGRSRILVPIGVLTALCAGYFAGGVYFREECAEDEGLQVQREQFVEAWGVGPTDEYTPIDADNDAMPVHMPPAWTAATAQEDAQKDARLPTSELSQPEDQHFVTEAFPEPSLLIIRLRRFPGWHTLRDGEEVAPGVRPDGLIVVPLPPGVGHHVEVVYRTTWDQWTGLGVTAATLLFCGAVMRRRRSGIMGPSA